MREPSSPRRPARRTALGLLADPCGYSEAADSYEENLTARATLPLVFLVMSGLVACSRQAPPPTLLIPINLRCTTCDDFIACRDHDAAPDALTGRAPATVYRLKEKSFWAQIATIGDYITQLWRDKTTDQRPLAIYRDTGRDRRIDTDLRWRAIVDTTNRTIRLPDGTISQTDGLWRAPDGAVRGQCEAMPRRAGYTLVREYLGKPPVAAAAPGSAAAR